MAKKDGDILQFPFISKNIKALRTSLKMSQGDVYDKLSISRQQYSNIETGYSSPSLKHLVVMTEIFGVSLDDLCLVDLSASKNILLTKTPKNVTLAKGDKLGDAKGDKRKLQKTSPFASYPIADESPEMNVADVGIVQRFPLRTDRPVEAQQVPVYDFTASAGIESLFLDANPILPSSYIMLPNLPPCDGAIHVWGDSMYPLLQSGDIVLYRRINDILTGIMWGEMYLIAMTMNDEDLVVVKYIQRSDDDTHIRLVSHNQFHSPKDVPISNIRALALIKASVRYNTMG